MPCLDEEWLGAAAAHAPAHASAVAASSQRERGRGAREDIRVYSRAGCAAGKSRGAVALLIGTQGRELLGGNARVSVRRPRQGLDELAECDDAHTLKALLLLQLLHGARGVPPAFLAVERQRHACRLRARGANDLERFAHRGDRKSTRLNSSHGYISYAVFCLKKKKKKKTMTYRCTY